MKAKKAKKPAFDPKRNLLLEKLAYCGLHRGVNMMFGSGCEEPTETDWPLSWSDRCGTCRNNYDVAKRAFYAGKAVGRRG